jgi:hypothetical protein
MDLTKEGVFHPPNFVLVLLSKFFDKSLRMLQLGLGELHVLRRALSL